jgi:high-affinity K+ transport system ATPase subunit B
MSQRWGSGRRRSLRTWRMIIVLWVVEIAAVANIIACVSVLVRHNTDLGLFTGLVAVALTFAVFGVSRATACAAGRTDGRPAHLSTNEDRGIHDFPH